MGLQMECFVCFVLSLIIITLSTADDVKYVEVPRFGEDMPTCVRKQVCADVFNSSRTLDDGTSQQEVRLLLNCKCDEDRFEHPCGHSRNQFVFRETQKQSLYTCEDANQFEVCEPGDAAKEKHTGDYWRDGYIYHVVNCVCPTNNSPRGFYQRMTRPMRARFFSQFVDFYTCRYF